MEGQSPAGRDQEQRETGRPHGAASRAPAGSSTNEKLIFKHLARYTGEGSKSTRTW